MKKGVAFQEHPSFPLSAEWSPTKELVVRSLGLLIIVLNPSG